MREVYVRGARRVPPEIEAAYLENFTAQWLKDIIGKLANEPGPFQITPLIAQKIVNCYANPRFRPLVKEIEIRLRYAPLTVVSDRG